MKKTVLCFIVLMPFCLLAGELVPIRQYDKLNYPAMIPDHHLLGTLGELLALGFFDDSEENFLNNFQKYLSLPEQYDIAYILIKLINDERAKVYFVSNYDAIKHRIGEKRFDEKYPEKFYRVWWKFLGNLENDIHKIDDFYNYARRVVNACDKNTSEDKQLYIADMLDLAISKKMKHASGEEKNRIMQFIVDAINKLTSNDAKTWLTLRLIRYMDEEQVRALNTTEYALIVSSYIILHQGKFLDFSGIYYELMQNLKDYTFDDMGTTTDEFCDHVPLKKWKSPQEAVDFIYKNREHLKFDDEKKIYIWK